MPAKMTATPVPSRFQLVFQRGRNLPEALSSSAATARAATFNGSVKSVFSVQESRLQQSCSADTRNRLRRVPARRRFRSAARIQFHQWAYRAAGTRLPATAPCSRSVARQQRARHVAEHLNPAHRAKEPIRRASFRRRCSNPIHVGSSVVHGGQLLLGRRAVR